MRVLVTGGAGFIGSHLAHALLSAGHDTRVLDDFSTGYPENVPGGAELIKGDVADAAVVRQALDGVEVVFHHAAARAVLRSVIDPLATDTTNTHGTLMVLQAAAELGVRRVISASSSSIYGGAAKRPTSEDAPLLPRSPYAVTKLAGEHYCRVFAELHGLETVSFRYFNVFGPRQRPDSAYAAVVPLFIEALRADRPPIVHGDGRQSRDFTYIDNVVAANLAAASAPPEACRGQAYNVAAGRPFSLLDLLAALGGILDTPPRPQHTEPRAGDVRHSHADISKARAFLGYHPEVSFEEGLRRTVDWFVAESVAAGTSPL
jgi:UDP-glucose 4-epimerase